jgi:SAM-dependent methyltransferase
MNEPADIVAQGYDAVYSALPNSVTLRRIWREHAAGPDFPDSFHHISFLTLPEMTRMSDELQLLPGQTLLDLGCGMAGPSLWIAQRTGVRLIGIDASTVAVAQATSRTGALGLANSARFQVGRFARTGVDAHSCHAAMSVDALQYAPDKHAAFTEAARVLRPGTRFVFVAFEYEPSRVEGLPVAGDDPVADYGPLLEEAGFTVEANEETPGWRERLAAAFGAAVSEKEKLRGEMGDVAVNAFMLEAETTLAVQPYRRRVFVVAQRR